MDLYQIWMYQSAIFFLVWKVVLSATLPYECDFEKDVCGMQQSENDAFDWTRRSGSTETEGTGPTQAQNGQFYIYIETDDNQGGNYALFETPILDETGLVCLSFYYHMYGSYVGSLYVHTTVKDPWMALSGTQGNLWRHKYVEVNLNSNDKIIFKATVGGAYYGDIAVDNFKITRGKCPLFECDFDGGEADICGMSQQTNDNYDWTWTNSGTPGEYTGPDAAQSPYGYIFSDPINKPVGNKARVNTGPLEHNGPVCIDFYYYMYGRDIGENALMMYKRNEAEGGQEVNFWYVTGEQGEMWKHYRETVYGISQDISIGWTATAYGQDSIVAVDSIMITAGNCPVSTQLPFVCSFESGYCGMVQRDSDQFDWRRRSEATPTDGTGPAAAKSGQFFIYTEADDQQEGQRAYLDTKMILYSGSTCLRFDYYMEGSDIGQLFVFGSHLGEEQPYFSRTGDQGAGWRFSNLDITLQYEEKISWTAIIGTGSRGDIAIDNIQILNGTCSVQTTTRSPTSTTTRLYKSTTAGTSSANETTSTTQKPLGNLRVPFRCDFEDVSACDLVQRTEDNFDWTRHEGRTPTDTTGPLRAQNGSYYLYIETDARGEGEEAVLMTPPYPQGGDLCLRFYRHMYGRDTGSLIVYSTNKSPSEPWGRFTGEYSSQWLEEAITLILRPDEKIFIKGTVGKGNLGDIAIDNLSITEGKCPDEYSGYRVALPYSCTVEDMSRCYMVQVEDDDMDWTLHSGRTPSEGTGPGAAASGDAYLFMEATNQQTGDTATIETPMFLYRGKVCLMFALHMTGADVGTLDIIRSSRPEWPIKRYRGDQGEMWQSVSQALTLDSNEKLLFKGTIGAGEQGDIAIDDISVRQGECDADTTTSTTTKKTTSEKTAASPTTISATETVTHSDYTSPQAMTTEAVPQQTSKVYIIVIGVLGAICAALLCVAIVALIYVKILKSRKVGDDVTHNPDAIERRSAAHTSASRPDPRYNGNHGNHRNHSNRDTELVSNPVPPKGSDLPTMASLGSLPPGHQKAGALPPLHGASVTRSADPFTGTRIGNIGH